MAVRPDIREFAADPRRFLEAMRRFHGLSYAELAAQIRARVRGRHRTRSETYFYRLCCGRAELNADVLDGLVAALELDHVEERYLREYVAGDESAALGRPKAAVRALLRALRGDDEVADADAGLLKALVSPLVTALYTAAGARGRGPQRIRDLAAAAVGRRTSSREIREALAVLRDADLIADGGSGDAVELAHRMPGTNLVVRAAERLPAGPTARALKLYYAALDKWGTDALQTVPRQRRYFRSTTALIRSADVPEFQQRLAAAWEQLQQELLAEYRNDGGDVVMHLGVRSWPMMELGEERETDHDGD